MAPDGGLYYPVQVPKLDCKLIEKWKKLRGSGLAYNSMAFDVMSLYAGNSIPPQVLKSIIDKASQSFRLPNWTNIVSFSNPCPTTDPSPPAVLRCLELFHGPTYSFKDYSIMILGGLLNYFLKKRNRHGTVLVATSGDTGSAAIAGLRGQSNIKCAVLLPQGKVSDIQQKMMTTVDSTNIKSILVQGSLRLRISSLPDSSSQEILMTANGF
eukprot:Protomagalhaensia_sp_Gyna_25__483@NODE_1228_length_2047_cov_6_000498_g979_i0_p2_GENE_NODE_1228_length_2047_cov_6_000498_g979_i0NODE_1228_length_2047_cov_6_000498_g979_i0_p2_ORF_typecomplete_len229_score37_84Thr_synth_N/PF14821_6/1e19PALP/PF00291_25/1_5e14PLN_propep/PF16485_5/0_34_NODE_1228_length_2047_cov_6_000498_g979_i055687